MVQYISDPACCSSNRTQIQSYQTSQSTQTTTSAICQPQKQQQLYIQQRTSTNEQRTLFRPTKIIYRKPSSVRLRPKDAATQTDPIGWVERSDKILPRKELKFSNRFIEHIISLNVKSTSVKNHNRC